MAGDTFTYPKWVRGYRRHGYHLTPMQVVAEVSLPPPVRLAERPNGVFYSWYLRNPNHANTPLPIEGQAPSLRQAKRDAVKAWQEYEEKMKQAD